MDTTINETTVWNLVIMKLPGELRNLVHSYLPLYGTPSDYRGYLLSSKLAYQEASSFFIAEINKELQDVEKAWHRETDTCLRVNKPSSLEEARTITVQLPYSYFCQQSIPSFHDLFGRPLIQDVPDCPEAPLHGLLSLPCTNLQFKLYDDPPTPWSITRLRRFAKNFMAFCRELDELILNDIKANSFAVEWGSFPEYNGHEMTFRQSHQRGVEDRLISRFEPEYIPHQDWEYELYRADGATTGYHGVSSHEFGCMKFFLGDPRFRLRFQSSPQYRILGEAAVIGIRVRTFRRDRKYNPVTGEETGPPIYAEE